MKIQKILLLGVLLPGVALANPIPVQGKKAAPPVVIPPQYQPKIPVAPVPSLPKVGKMLRFGAESRYAVQAQNLQNQIAILKLEAQVTALQTKINKDSEKNSSIAKVTGLAKSQGNYVSTVIGFHNHWRANLVLDGHGYWVQPGEETSLGRVLRINGSGVWLQTQQGKVLIGMRSEGVGLSATMQSSSPSFATPTSTKKPFSRVSSSAPQMVPSPPVVR